MISPSTQPQWVFERNPYYWAVDTDGNQLPYIDKVQYTLAENLEVLNLRAIAGEFDHQERHVDIGPIAGEAARCTPHRGRIDCGHSHPTWAPLRQRTRRHQAGLAQRSGLHCSAGGYFRHQEWWMRHHRHAYDHRCRLVLTSPQLSCPRT